MESINIICIPFISQCRSPLRPFTLDVFLLEVPGPSEPGGNSPQILADIEAKHIPLIYSLLYFGIPPPEFQNFHTVLSIDFQKWPLINCLTFAFNLLVCTYLSLTARI